MADAPEPSRTALPEGPGGASTGTAPRPGTPPSDPLTEPVPGQRNPAPVRRPGPVRRQQRHRGPLERALRWMLAVVAPRAPKVLAVVGVALAGGAIGAALAPSTTAEVGPLQAEVRVIPSLRPGVHLLLPPAGQVEFDTHAAPVAMEARIAQVDLEGARALLESPAQLRALGDTAPRQLRDAAIRAALTTVGCCLAGALLLSLLVFRTRWRRTAQVGGTVVVVVLATAGATAATAEPDRLAQPRFTGLLSSAPYIAGSAPGVLERLETYRSGLSDIVRSVTSLYATAGQLPTAGTADADGVVTVLHVSDIHLNPLAFDLIDKLVAQFGVDVVVDTGDITTWGTGVETQTLRRIGQLPVPYVFVRGNHDSATTQQGVAANRNAVVLDGRVVEVAGLVMAGVADPEFTPDAQPPPSIAPQATLGGAAATTPDDPQLRANERLAGVISSWDEANPDKKVQLAAVHEPESLEPLFGTVPLVLAGHTHKRETRVDRATGTRVLVEGSTGGAGITASGLERLSNGKPLPLAASLLYVSTEGERAGQVVAIDAITVGGFGLTSVNLERTVIRPEDVPEPEPTPTPATTSGPPTP